MNSDNLAAYGLPSSTATKVYADSKQIYAITTFFRHKTPNSRTRVLRAHYTFAFHHRENSSTTAVAATLKTAGAIRR
jgi:hypothetical protein